MNVALVTLINFLTDIYIKIMKRGRKRNNSKAFKDELQPSRALPIDEDDQTSEYEMPDEYGEALAYLRGVRCESNQTPHVFTSKNFVSSSVTTSTQNESVMSLSRLVFQPTQHH